MTRYQVVGECAHVVTADHTGVTAMRLLYKGAFVPEDATAERIEHLLKAGLIAEVGEVPLAPNSAVEQPNPGAPSPSADAETAGDGLHPVVTEADRQAQRAKADEDAQAEQERAAARAKLDEMGGIPDGRSSEAVWVEYAVRQGLDRTEAQAAGKDELRKVLAK